MLTARSSLTDTVAALDGGADDYMVKPFRMGELLARVRLRLRAEQHSREPLVLRSGDLLLDLRARRVIVGSREVTLSAREFALTEVLLRHPSVALSREQLLSQVWGLSFEPESNVVDVYIRYLRQKLGHGRIETVRGVGYRLVEYSVRE
jgi:DNA-binding response OmpR family regulator